MWLILSLKLSLSNSIKKLQFYGSQKNGFARMEDEGGYDRALIVETARLSVLQLPLLHVVLFIINPTLL